MNRTAVKSPSSLRCLNLGQWIDTLGTLLQRKPMELPLRICSCCLAVALSCEYRRWLGFSTCVPNSDSIIRLERCRRLVPCQRFAATGCEVGNVSMKRVSMQVYRPEALETRSDGNLFLVVPFTIAPRKKSHKHTKTRTRYSSI